MSHQYIRQWVEAAGVSRPEYAYEPILEEIDQTIGDLFFLIGEIDAVLFDTPQLGDPDYLRGWYSMLEEIQRESEKPEEF